MKHNGLKRDPRAFFEAPDGRLQFVKQVLVEELHAAGCFRRVWKLRLALVSEPISSVPFSFGSHAASRAMTASSRPHGLFRLRFPRPVTGPIALGHSCHFGLGLFVPE